MLFFIISSLAQSGGKKNVTAQRGKNKKISLVASRTDAVNAVAKLCVFTKRKGRVHRFLRFLRQACGRTALFPFSNGNMKIYNSLGPVTRFGSSCSQKPVLC